MVEIEHNIPIPTKAKKTRVYEFGNMKVGDSLFVEGKSGVSMRSAAVFFKKDHPGWDYTSREMDGGVRLWCISVPE